MSSSASPLPELLAPAGSWDCAKAAIENGADAIYFGLDRFNARMRAENFTEADLPELMAALHRRGVKGYLALNTLIFTKELPQVEAYLRSVIAAGVDAAIVQDVGLCRLIRHLSPDFPIHASTQMTITSAAGVAFAESLGCSLVVLARECSVREIEKIRQQMGRHVALPLEVFVHGALCVAYSGQCLTSEALGGRSANRGECAQACRMPYDLIVDGEPLNLADAQGQRRYLLSPQDLAGLPLLPELVRSGVSCLKIEGRLKTPEYVASVTQVYRQALDRLQHLPARPESGDLAPGNVDREATPLGGPASREEQYRLEMAFSRGLYSGWLGGIDNQALVQGRYAKKRGAYLGQVALVQRGSVTLRLDPALAQLEAAAVKPGDGLVFEGSAGGHETGGRVYESSRRGDRVTLSFGKAFDTRAITAGDRAWKTSDPELDRQVRQTYAGETPRAQQPVVLEVHGAIAAPLTLIARDSQGHVVQVQSAMPLVAAHSRPLGEPTLRKQLGRLGNTPFTLSRLDIQLDGDLMLPLSELNRLRREAVLQLEEARSRPVRWAMRAEATHGDLMPAQLSPSPADPALIVLVRRLDQIQAALEAGITTLYCELEDPRAYRQAVQMVRQFTPSGDRPELDSAEGAPAEIWVAPPRIAKPLENWILDQVSRCGADGYLARNYDHLAYFAGRPCVGDFSLNVANPIAAAHFKGLGLHRLTASYDLNAHQLEHLLRRTPSWFEVTLHQHMPLFHMEHCVFCAFLSEGTDYRDCGRPCETHSVKLRDRAGVDHMLQADAGCRNTLFNGTAQTGAEYVHRLLELGLRHVRIEFLQEPPSEVSQIIQHYQRLLRGEIGGAQLWQTLKLQNRLGVTRGPLDL
ncbi:MAG: DUF3656 domain-containing protein [Elainellaceae cyanobacterium]